MDVFEILPWPHLDVGYTLFVHVLDSPPYIQFSRNMYSRNTFKLNKVCHELNVILVVFSTYKYSDKCKTIPDYLVCWDEFDDNKGGQSTQMKKTDKEHQKNQQFFDWTGNIREDKLQVFFQEYPVVDVFSSEDRSFVLMQKFGWPFKLILLNGIQNYKDTQTHDKG